MYDNIKGTFISSDLRHFESEVCNFKEVITHGSRFLFNDPQSDGMRFKYDIQKKLFVFENSLHKYYKGDNISDFSRGDIKMATEKLCDHLKIKSTEVKSIPQIEVGLNVGVRDIKKILNSLHVHRTEPFRWNPKSSRSLEDWGKGASHTDYKIKFYDKEIQQKITYKYKSIKKPSFQDFWDDSIRKLCMEPDSDLLRYEIQFRRTKYFIPSLVSLDSLHSHKSLLEVKTLLMKNLTQITFRNNYENLSKRDLEIVHCYEDEHFFETYILNQTPDLKKKYKRSYENAISKATSVDNSYCQMISTIEEKIDSLIY